jgi:hypothetical protein
MNNIKTFDQFNESMKINESDTIVLWADKVTGDLEKAIKKAKVKGKSNIYSIWDKEFITNAENGHGTVFFINALNKADAMEKIKKARLMPGKKNTYKY